MMSYNITHLKQLEAESIHIMREVVAECKRPVMLYSVGKDSSVLLHLARKAFRESLRLRDDQARLWKELAELEGTMGRLGDAQSSRLQYERLTGKKNFAGGE